MIGFLIFVFFYVILSFILACLFSDVGDMDDLCRTAVFWPLLFIKWFLKQSFDVLFKDWRD